MNQKKPWLELLVQLNKKKILLHDAQCPKCQEKHLKYKYFGNIENRIGYEVFWCDSCKKGIRISRVIVPEDEEIVSIDDEEHIRKETPEIELIE